MAAILKTDLYSKLERLGHWKLSLRCANANSISRRQRKQKTEKDGFKTLDLSGQCNKCLLQKMINPKDDLCHLTTTVTTVN
jgi:hypothetical protein